MSDLVLVIDDSALMRKHLRQILETAGYAVVTARNGQEGIDKLEQCNPDVVTLDVNMPVMDGITCLSLIMAKRPTPVIMISSITDKGALATLEALELGALDYILKPGGTVSLNIRDIEDELLQKIEAALEANIIPRSDLPDQATSAMSLKQRIRDQRPKEQATTKDPSSAGEPLAETDCFKSVERKSGMQPCAPEVVIIGVSTGGPRTLERLLTDLPVDFPLPVVIAQHMPARFTKVFAERLNKLTDLPVLEVSEPTKIESGKVFIAQGDADLKIVKRVGRLMLVSVPIDKKFVWHPSVERLAQSAITIYNPEKIIFVQLTGMGNDGAQAMAEAYQQGARTIAESEETAVVFGMPKELIRLGGAEVVLPSCEIAGVLVSWVS